jgi:hypothetical protein
MRSFLLSFSPEKSGELRLPPLISREKDSGLPPVTTEKTSCPSGYYKLLDALSSNMPKMNRNDFVHKVLIWSLMIKSAMLTSGEIRKF